MNIEVRARQGARKLVGGLVRTGYALSSRLGRRALRMGVLPTVSPQNLLRRLSPDLVIDVGANRGQFALDVVSASPGSQVIAFEPLESESEVFKRVFHDVPGVSLRGCALSDWSGRAAMNVSRAVDSSSLLEFRRLQDRTFPGTGRVGQSPVEVMTLREAIDLDSLPPRSMLKADVQGSELAVMRGAGPALCRFAWVYLEVSFLSFYEGQPQVSEIVEYLQSNGFAIADVVSLTRVGGRTVQADLLFERVELSTDWVDGNESSRSS